MIIEYRNRRNKIQLSYCWPARAKGEKSEPQFEEDEIRGGFALKWISWDETFKLFKNDKPDKYDGPFIHKRDLIFLRRVKNY